MSKKLTKEELELMSYNDITNMLLKESPQATTLDLFTKIVDMLGLPKQTLESKIGEFYTALTNDKRFILLEDGTWDLKSNHKTQNYAIEDDLEDYEEDIEEEYDDIPETSEENEDIYSDDSEEDSGDVAEEYKNLVIVDEEDLDQN